MERNNIMSIYDKLCFALTAYESDNVDQEYDKAEALYNDICDIVNDIASMLN